VARGHQLRAGGRTRPSPTAQRTWQWLLPGKTAEQTGGEGGPYQRLGTDPQEHGNTTTELDESAGLPQEEE